MAVQFYNTLKRCKEPLQSHDPQHIKMYVCGPTVYDRAHLGNARSAIVFDMVYRVLQLSYSVQYVRNITDIDDKIINESLRTQRPIDDITRETTAFYHQDMAALNVLKPTHEPRATEYVDAMIAFIAQLVAHGHAYVAEKHVLFDVGRSKNYGKLSGCNHDEIIAGARVEVAPYKKNPADFILWKPSDDRIIGWTSPWGRGRPGWHIECSVMSYHLLGETFDIHGGGQDLIFPHHENEIAQSTALFGSDSFAQTWLHNGILTVNGEKMSKSLGNFITVGDLLKQANGEVIRFAVLSTHYRQPLSWSKQTLELAKKNLDRLYTALYLSTHSDNATNMTTATDDNVRASLEDDLNTPQAIAHLHDIASRIHKTKDVKERQHLQAQLRSSANLMGFLYKTSSDWFQNTNRNEQSLLTADHIESLINDRQLARGNKDFQEADRIRQHLIDHKVIIEDNPRGTQWRRI